MEIFNVLKSLMFSLRGGETCLRSFEILPAGARRKYKAFLLSHFFVFFQLKFFEFFGYGLNKSRPEKRAKAVPGTSGHRYTA
jgi:hypothetical protein